MTIAYQLALSIPETRPHIEQAIKTDPLFFSKSLEHQAKVLIVLPVVAILHEPRLASKQYRRIIIVDGLDECSNSNEQYRILQVLSWLLRNLPIPFAILLASRPEHHIRDAFNSRVLNEQSSRLSLDDSYKPDQDIEKFLRDRFNAIQETHHFKSYLPNSWPSQEIIDKLVAKASGQFIYASTVDKFISSPKHNPAARLDILLGARTLNTGKLKPFEELDNLYATIFDMIDQEDLASTLRVLGALLVQYTSATYTSMTYMRSPRNLEKLFRLEPGDIRRLLFELESLLIIIGDDESIRFFHASLSDYLFDRSRSGSFFIDEEIVYADLAGCCIWHLTESPDWVGEYFGSAIVRLFHKPQ